MAEHATAGPETSYTPDSVDGSRRRFLRLVGLAGLGGAVGGSLLTLSACQTTSSTPSTSTSQPTPAAASQPAAATTAPAAKAAAPTVNLKIGVVGAGSFSPFTAGVDLDLFKNDGLLVEVIEHRGGAEAAQAMVGGGIDIFNGDFSHALRLNEQGQAIRVISATTERHAYTLLGAPDAKPGVEALRGQKIGITSPGSQTDNSMRWLLLKNGIDPDREAELVAVGGGTTMLAAIQQKQVYAGMLVDPFTSQLKLQNYVTVYDFAEQVGPFQGTVMMAKQSWLRDNGETARRFLASYLNVVDKLRNDENLRNQAAAATYPTLDPQIRQAAAAEMIKAYPPDGRVTQEGVARVFEFDSVARGTQVTPPPLSDFADFSYLRS